MTWPVTYDDASLTRPKVTSSTVPRRFNIDTSDNRERLTCALRRTDVPPPEAGSRSQSVGWGEPSMSIPCALVGG
jgi:hypothetical protein